MKKTVFVADDDSSIVDVVSMTLELQGFEVSSTLDAREVVPIMHARLPRRLSWTFGSERMDGRKIANAQGRCPTQHIPIVLFSANRDVERSAIQAGADTFIFKPFDMLELTRTVNRLAA